MIGKWTGAPLRTFSERFDATTTACMGIPTALHPQTPSAEFLRRKYGGPSNARARTKSGFPNYVTTTYVTNLRPRGFWTDRGYNWFIGS
jgi:hypothetical protein